MQTTRTTRKMIRQAYRDAYRFELANGCKIFSFVSFD